MALLTPPARGTKPRLAKTPPLISRIDRRWFVTMPIALAAIAALVVIVGRVVQPADAPLHVTSGWAQVASDGHHVSMSASLVNTTTSSQTGRVWWILSPPNEQPLWQHDIYRSADRGLSLAAGVAQTFTWQEDVLVPPGTYTLSIWVHRNLSNGTEVHSDELQVVDLRIPVGEGASHLRRHSAPTDGLVIAGASATMHGGADPSSLDGMATIDDTMSGASQPQLRWELVAIPSDGDWWSPGAAAEASKGAIAVSASSPVSAVVHSELLLPLGRYELRLTLVEHGNVVDQVLLDQVTPDFDHWDPSVSRFSGPVGAVAVESIATEHTWLDGRTNSLVAVVVNRTDQAQVTQVGWVLGRPGDPTPWNHLDAALDAPQTLVLSPHDAVRVSLPPQGTGGIVGPGTYQLAIWVHVRTASGAMVHSDAASAAAGVTVPSWDSSLLRLGLPEGPVAVDAVSAPTRWGKGQATTVTLRNMSALPQDARVWWVLGKVGDTQPFNDPVATLQPQPVIVLGPGEVRQVKLANPLSVVPGTYALSIWVHVKTSAGDFEHSDDVFGSQPVVVSATGQ